MAKSMGGTQHMKPSCGNILHLRISKALRRSSVKSCILHFSICIFRRNPFACSIYYNSTGPSFKETGG